MAGPPTFTELARRPDAAMDELALAMAAEFRAVDSAAALAQLDALGGALRDVVAAADGTAAGETRACVELLGGREGFAGDRERYDDPQNSMLDVVLAHRRGLPIALSVVYMEVARRAGVPLAGVGLPGHYVVGHFGAEPPVLIDPFAGGEPVEVRHPDPLVRPWTPHETAMRMLNNLVGSFQRRGDIGAAIRAAELRMALPAEEALVESLRADLRAMQARLN
jgi:regulator of sirC expression with transglutaminase-like and TPR domain